MPLVHDSLDSFDGVFGHGRGVASFGKGAGLSDHEMVWSKYAVDAGMSLVGEWMHFEVWDIITDCLNNAPESLTDATSVRADYPVADRLVRTLSTRCFPSVRMSRIWNESGRVFYGKDSDEAVTGYHDFRRTLLGLTYDNILEGVLAKKCVASNFPKWYFSVKQTQETLEQMLMPVVLADSNSAYKRLGEFVGIPYHGAWAPEERHWSFVLSHACQWDITEKEGFAAHSLAYLRSIMANSGPPFPGGKS